MSRHTNPLEDLRINSPCSADWDEMVGNSQVRFCEHCRLSVHDLSEMTIADALHLVRKSEGRLCVRFKRGADGTPQFPPLPQKLHYIKRRASRIAAGAFTAVLGLGTSALAQTFNEPAVSNDVEVTSQDTPTCKVRLGTGSASLSGTVIDPSGAVVAGASITLLNNRDGCEQTTTNDEGVFNFQSIEEGTYTLKASAPGFSEAEIREVALREGEESSVKIKLALGYIMGDVVVVVEADEPLVLAAEEDKLEALKELLATGADVNVLDKNRDHTALMEAMIHNNREMVQVLLRAGADVNLRNSEGQTALMMLDEDTTTDLFWDLVAWGVKVNQRNQRGLTALMNAAACDNEDLLRALLSAGAKVDAKDDQGKTALMIAAGEGHTASVRALLAAGANVNRKDKEDWTALKHAEDNDHDEVVVLLQSYGASQ